MRYLAGDARAFVAAIRRELRAIRRYPTLIFGTLFWPILLPGTYVLAGRVYSGNDPRALAAFAERSGTVEVAGFIFVGFAMYMWLSIFLWGPGTALRQEQLRGTLEAVFVTPASRLVALFGPPLAHVWTVATQLVVMALALRIVFGVELPVEAFLRALVVIAVGIPAMYAIASLFSLAVLRYGEIGPLVQFVRGFFVLLSGVTFPLVMLPGWAQAVAVILPPTYIVADTRAVLLSGTDLAAVARDLAIVIALAAATIVLAVIAYDRIERSAKRTGMLGSY